jgi:hypothetical protein
MLSAAMLAKAADLYQKDYGSDTARMAFTLFLVRQTLKATIPGQDGDLCMVPAFPDLVQSVEYDILLDEPLRPRSSRQLFRHLRISTLPVPLPQAMS